LWYFALFALLYKLVASERVRILCVAFAFILLSFLWATNSILKLEWKFLFFLWIFYAGMLLADKGRLKKIMDAIDKYWLFLIAVTIICAASTLATPTIASDNLLLAEMVNMPVFIAIRNVFCITAVLLSLWIFSKAPSILAKPAEFIGCGMVFAYIMQPFVSSAVAFGITFGNYSYPAMLPAWQLAFAILLAFLFSVMLGYAMQKCYDKAIASIKNR
jgi:hypothetical protein